MDKGNWTYRKLGEICEVQNGLWTGKKPPFVKVGVIRNTNFTKDCTLDDSDIFFTDVEEKAYKKRKLLKGDIIIEKSGGSEKQPVGRPILFDLDGEYSFSNFTSVLRLNTNELTPSFLHKVLVGLYFQGKTRPLQSKTTGIHNLDFNKFLQFSIPVPPLPIQQRIVAELDCISGILEKKRQQLKELDNLAQAIFYDMFGDPVENEKGWEVKKLGEIGELSRGVSKHRPRNAPELLGGTMPLIQTGDVSNSGMYITEYNSTYSDIGVKQSRVWQKGTLCITIAANIGKCSILTFEACFPDSVVGFIPFEYACVEYMYFVFGAIQKMLENNAMGVAQKNINLGILNQLSLALPPLSLQQSFAAKIEAIEKQKERISQSIKEVQTLFDSRMQEYFG